VSSPRRDKDAAAPRYGEYVQNTCRFELSVAVGGVHQCVVLGDGPSFGAVPWVDPPHAYGE